MKKIFNPISYMEKHYFSRKDLIFKKGNYIYINNKKFLIKSYRIKAQPTEEIKSFQRDLYGIANNINQIAKVANSRYSVSHDDYKYISNTLADFILRFERKIYSRQK